MAKPSQAIVIKGAAEHNLQVIDTLITRNAITVITGVSGSGKSSLAFDTVLSEAQRRFFYTLSHYSRQFLDIGTRPLVRSITGLSPAIGLAQNETQPSRRASVGTLTDMAELVGVMFAQFGRRLCPTHAQPTSSLTPAEMVKGVLSSFDGDLVAVCAPLAEQKKGQFRRKLEGLAERGFMRVFVDGKTVNLNPIPELAKDEKHTLKLVIDFVQVQSKSAARLLRSLELALAEGEGVVEVIPCTAKGQLQMARLCRLSAFEGCPTCHFSWPALDARFFSANSLGRCPTCAGYGSQWAGGEYEEDEEEATSAALANPDICGDCHGTGLNPLYHHIKIAERSALDCHRLPLAELQRFIVGIDTPELLSNPAFVRVRDELLALVARVCAIGLAYLSLSRRVRSLSGGEAQRLKLAGILSENLRGVLYVLDEPSQGLHPHELELLYKNLQRLKEMGNTVLMVDHDEYLIRHADWIIDMGPGGGRHGGKIMARFAPPAAHKHQKESLTARFLCQASHDKLVDGSIKKTVPAATSYLELCGASLHNLQIPRVRFAEGGLNVVTGVSGAGKSTLVLSTLYPIAEDLALGYSEDESLPSHCQGARGFDFAGVDLIDRKPIGKSTVSMAATYLDVFTDIRKLYERLPDAQLQGLASRAFSLHVDGGRCDECKGRGEVLLKMKFLADARVKCTICHGKRYKDIILGVQYRGLSIADVLDLTIEEAVAHFKNHKNIVKRLEPADALGLGYLKLGQPSSSLSGGEAQRLKLAPYLGKGQNPRAHGNKKRLFILEEPTQGLHLQDTQLLIKALRKLVSEGMTVVVIEHSSEVIAAADWVVDLGPQAAEEGGRVVYEGPPLGIIQAKDSLTGRYLRHWLQANE